MTTSSVPALRLPDSTTIPDSPDFEHIEWWTHPSLLGVLTEVSPRLWCLLCDLVNDRTTVTAERLHTDMPAILALISALWMRRPARSELPQPHELPHRLAPLLGADIRTWHSLGRLGAAWCLARLSTYARHLHHPAHQCAHHRLEDLTPMAWRLLTDDEGSYLYTAELAARYDRDRPHDPELIDALTTFATTRLAGREVIEIGAGTGAITTITAPHAHRLVAVEPAAGMRAILTDRTSHLAHVHVTGQDCMSVDLPQGSADIVIEHAALCFVDEPLFAVAEAARLLREGGALMRIITSQRHPESVTAFNAAFHAELRRLGHHRGRIVSSGNDTRITNALAAAEIPTQLDTIATWTTTHPLHHHLEPLRHGSYPYLTSMPTADRDHAIRAALRETDLAPDTSIETARGVTIATSVLHPLASRVLRR